MVLQALEGRSDREACRALQTDIAWKAAAGLALTDAAFHPTVLTLWRNKLRASGDPDRIFNMVRAVIAQTGVVAGRHRRVLDPTVLDDAVARQDTVTMLATQIRRVRRLVPALVERVWVREHNLEPGRPPCDWDDPTDVDRLVCELVDDANELVWAAEELELNKAQTDAVALLALVAGQDVEPGDGPGRWRIARRSAPDRVISTVDPETRHAHKTRHAYRDGYKAHVAVEPDTGLVTDCELTAGNTGDAEAPPGLLEGEPAGTEVLGDSAYGTGKLRNHLADRDMTQLGLDAIRRTIDSKLVGAVLTTKYAAPHLRSGGSITFTGGIAADRPAAGGSIVAAVNSALVGLTHALALELAPIRVNLLAPGWVDTPVWETVAGANKRTMLDGMARRLPVGRIGTPTDIAQAALFAISAPFLTGAVLHIDGGQRLV